MGHSRWSDAAYQARQSHRRTTGTTAFTYHDHVRATGSVQVHDQMNPYGVTRESRDSEALTVLASLLIASRRSGSSERVTRTM